MIKKELSSFKMEIIMLEPYKKAFWKVKEKLLNFQLKPVIKYFLMKDNGKTICLMEKELRKLDKILSIKEILWTEKNKEQVYLILETVQNILDSLKIIKFLDKENIQLHKMSGKVFGMMDT